MCFYFSTTCEYLSIYKLLASTRAFTLSLILQWWPSDYKLTILAAVISSMSSKLKKVFMMKFFTCVPELSKLGLATALTSRVIRQASALVYKGIKMTVSHEAVVMSCLDNGMKGMAETSFQGVPGGVSFLAMKIN